MPRLSKAQIEARDATRAAHRSAALAKVKAAGCAGISSIEMAQALALPVSLVIARLLELVEQGAIEHCPRYRIGDAPAVRKFVEAGLRDMHIAWLDAWKAEAKRQRIAALPKKQPKAVKPPKPAKPPKAVKPAKPEPNPLDRLWSKGRFAHVRLAAGTVPPPETRGVRSIFEVAA